MRYELAILEFWVWSEFRNDREISFFCKINSGVPALRSPPMSRFSHFFSRSQIRPRGVSLLLALAWFTPGGVAFAQEIRLLKNLPEAPDHEIELNGPGWFSPPYQDAENEGFLFWRCVTGTNAHELVESLFFLKLRPGNKKGELRVRATVPAQAYFNLHQGYGTREAHGVALDHEGGAYYLWATSVVRVGDDGKKLWPSLTGPPDKSGRLWRYPGVLYTTNLRERVHSATLDGDGQGQALVFWESDSGMRAQKIAPWGARLWGDTGLLLGDRRHTRGRGVSDGAGGAIVLVARRDGTGVARIKFVSPQGRVTAEIGTDTAFDRGEWVARSDGAGGMLLLYVQPVIRGDKRLGGEIHLARFHPRLGRVYDRQLSPLIPDHLEPGGLYLNAGQQGTALASWRHLARQRRRSVALLPGIRPAPDQIQETIARRFVRLDVHGRFLWEPLRLELPPRAGYRRNDEGRVSLLDHGDQTLVLLESLQPERKKLTLFLQTIDNAGRFILPGAGQALAEGERDSFRPFLWKLQGRPAAVFFRTRRINESKQRYEPYLKWLTPGQNTPKSP